MSRRIVVVAFSIISIFLLVLYISSLKNNSVKLSKYTGILEQVDFEIDLDIYDNAILFLLESINSIGGIDRKKFDSGKLEFGDIVANDLLMDIEIRVEEMERDGKENGSDTIENDGTYYGLKVEKEGDLGYPIFGKYFEIIDYGNRKESQESLEEFKSLPEYTIIESNAYKGAILVRVDNKFSGEKLVKVKLDNNKTIVGIDILEVGE